jgi:hypothetical protein
MLLELKYLSSRGTAHCSPSHVTNNEMVGIEKPTYSNFWVPTVVCPKASFAETQRRFFLQIGTITSQWYDIFA